MYYIGNPIYYVRKPIYYVENPKCYIETPICFMAFSTYDAALAAMPNESPVVGTGLNIS